MTKIKSKLLFAFGTTILVLLLVMTLNSMYSKKSARTHELLELRIDPAIEILNKFDSYNKELYLLSLNKVTSNRNEAITNQTKKIIEVELPHLNTKALNLISTFSSDDSKRSAFDKIIVLSNRTIITVSNIYRLLQTKNDYSNSKKIKAATILLNDKLAIETTEIKHAVATLRLDFNTENKLKRAEFAEQLKNLSTIILITSTIAIFIIFIIAYKTVKSIVGPITVLKEGAKRIAKGDYQYQVVLKGKDEISMLGNNFNEMAKSLDTSFDSINRKNKELEQFVYIASHDLQEPLRTISSFSELLKNQYEGKLDETGNKSLHFISQASSRMQYLVKDLMDYSRLGNEKDVEVIDCENLVLGVKNDLSVLINDTNSELIINKLPNLNGYKTSLRLLFQNLINNAMKFQKPDIKPIVEVFAEEDENFWKFGVKDNGIGILPEHQDRIFSIFKRLHSKNEYEGTGIGLAHCQKIIELHGGTIWVESEIDKGSTFYFTLSKKLTEA